MPGMDGNPGVQDWWEDFQNWLSAAKQQINNTASGFGLARGQQNPINQWQPTQEVLTEDDKRFMLGDRPYNVMTNAANWYRNKVVPLWQGMKKP